MQTITRGTEIRAARRKLTARLNHALPIPTRRHVGFPAGNVPDPRPRFDTADAANSLWWYQFLSDKGKVDINLFGLDDTRNDPKSMNIFFQFNFPLNGVIRNQGGIFVRDGARLLLANRGIMTRGRSRVKREPLLAQLHNRVVEVDDDGRTSRVIVIAELDSPSLVEDLKLFAGEAREACERVISGVTTPMRGTPATTFTLPSTDRRDCFDEFFGKRPTGGKRGARTGVAECYHGAIVKALRGELRARGEVTNTKYVDLALERARDLVVFEVKTSASPQAVYTALGQVLFHGEAQRIDGKRIVRCLVLPLLPDPKAAARLKSTGLDLRYVAFERQPDGRYRFEGLDVL